MHEVMEKDPADLTIMDLKLPKDDGFELTRQLRDKYSVGIIILTSKDDTVDRVVGLEVGADDYVTKPGKSESFWLAFAVSCAASKNGQRSAPRR
jgi:two-component system torCAD operon response regulator TorR